MPRVKARTPKSKTSKTAKSSWSIFLLPYLVFMLAMTSQLILLFVFSAIGSSQNGYEYPRSIIALAITAFLFWRITTFSDVPGRYGSLKRLALVAVAAGVVVAFEHAYSGSDISGGATGINWFKRPENTVYLGSFLVMLVMAFTYSSAAIKSQRRREHAPYI